MPLDRLVDLGVERRRVADVEHGRVAVQFDRDGRRGVGADVVDDDGGPIGRETPRERGAEAGAFSRARTGVVTGRPSVLRRAGGALGSGPAGGLILAYKDPSL